MEKFIFNKTFATISICSVIFFFGSKCFMDATEGSAHNIFFVMTCIGAVAILLCLGCICGFAINDVIEESAKERDNDIH